MGQMIVRKLDDAVLERIRAKAKAEGKSAEQVARETLSAAFVTDREELVRRAAAIRAHSRPVDLDTTEAIMRRAREERDSRPYLPDLDGDR